MGISQFHFRGAAVASFGEDDVQHLGCGHRIGPKRFIKSPTRNSNTVSGCLTLIRLYCFIKGVSLPATGEEIGGVFPGEDLECNPELGWRQVRRTRYSQGVHIGGAQSWAGGPVTTGWPSAIHPLMPFSRLYTSWWPALMSSFAVSPLLPPPAQ